MSRIGKAPVAVPNGVTVTLKDGNVISVKGPKGELTRSLPAAMAVDAGERAGHRHASVGRGSSTSRCTG